MELLLNLTFFEHQDAQARVISRNCFSCLLRAAQDLLVNGTLNRTDSTSLAEFEVEPHHFARFCVHENARVWTEQPALHAVNTLGLTENRSKCPPAARFVLNRIACL
jgi:hypothetical protein